MYTARRVLRPDGESSRKGVFPADFIRAAGSERNYRKENHLPARSSHDCLPQFCRQILAEETVRIHWQVGPVFLDDPAL